MKLVESEIELSVAPAQVWIALTDFASYPTWNPFLIKMDAALRKDAQFKAMSRLPSGLKLGFVGRILSVTPNEEVAWVGHPTMMPAWAMEVRHTITLAPTEQGTRMHQLEEASGSLIPMSGWILGQAHDGQVAMNNALQQKLQGGR